MQKKGGQRDREKRRSALDFSVTFRKNGTLCPGFFLVGFQFLSRLIDIYIPAPCIIPAVVPRANIKRPGSATSRGTGILPLNFF